jgi:hypothetical protein
MNITTDDLVNSGVLASPGYALRQHAPFRMAFADAIAVLADEIRAGSPEYPYPIETLVIGLVEAVHITITRSVIRSFSKAGA